MIGSGNGLVGLHSGVAGLDIISVYGLCMVTFWHSRCLGKSPRVLPRKCPFRSVCLWACSLTFLPCQRVDAQTPPPLPAGSCALLLPTAGVWLQARRGNVCHVRMLIKVGLFTEISPNHQNHINNYFEPNDTDQNSIWSRQVWSKQNLFIIIYGNYCYLNVNNFINNWWFVLVIVLGQCKRIIPQWCWGIFHISSEMRSCQ